MEHILNILELKHEDVTFRAFINVICELPDEWLDAHFKSQTSFFVRPHNDYEIIDIDSVLFNSFVKTNFGQNGEDFRAASEQEEFKIFGPKLCSNKNEGVFIDTTVRKLRHFRENGLNLLKFNFFYTGLRKKWTQRFSGDVELLARLVR